MAETCGEICLGFSEICAMMIETLMAEYEANL